MLTLEVAAPVDGLAEWLAAVAGVSSVAVDGLSAGFRAPKGAAFRHTLLKSLLDGGVPVSGLAERRMGLREIYREVAASDERAR